jgi:redox-sensitive bicupin YhaK (pirin superfamily)
VHSERTGAERRATGDKLHGLQCWVALPAALEEAAPAFAHHGVDALPVVRDRGKTVQVVVGSLYGARSPVATASETVFADVALEAGSVLPLDAAYEERAVYVLDGEIAIAGDRFGADRLLVFRPGDRIVIEAVTDAHLVILGGAAMDGPRHVWWNFVSSRLERIEQAKAEWTAGHFEKVPGDELEFIPLPDK